MVQFAPSWWLLMVWGIFSARGSAWWHRPIDVIHGRSCVMILKYSTSLNLLWITKCVLTSLQVIVYENNHETRVLFIKPMNCSWRSNNHSFNADRTKVLLVSTSIKDIESHHTTLAIAQTFMITVTSNGVSNHRRFDSWFLCEGNDQWLVVSTHKGPVMRKTLPCYEVIMESPHLAIETILY